MNQAAYEVKQAYENGEDYQNALQKLVQSTCNHPTRRVYRDRFTGKDSVIWTRCNQCEQCRNTKGNDTASRLYLDARKFQHAYFLTLTYKSYAVPSAIPRDLRSAFWHYDSYNDTGKACYSPCILDYSHFQRFLARLRTNLNRYYGGTTPILEYFVAGEMGEKWARPHWHAIIVCEAHIPESLVRKSWSIDNQLIGRYEYDDLFANGTMDGLSGKNGKRCFKYVFKYTGKVQDFNKSRVQFAVNFYLHEKEKNQIYQVCYEESKYLHQKLASFVARSGRAPGCIDRGEYEQLFGPMHSCSSGHALGKYYFQDHWKEFFDGNRRLPKPISAKPAVGDKQSDNSSAWTLSFPSYYERLLSRLREPICRRSVHIEKGTSSGKIDIADLYSLRAAFNDLSGAMASVYQYYHLEEDMVLPIEDLSEHFPQYRDYVQSIRRLFGFTDRLSPLEKYHFCYDYSTSCNIRPVAVVVCDGFCELYMERRKWSKAKGKFISCGLISFESFVQLVSDGFSASLKEWNKKKYDRFVQQFVLDKFVKPPETNSGVERNAAWSAAVEKNHLTWQTFKKQKLYKQRRTDTQ